MIKLPETVKRQKISAKSVKVASEKLFLDGVSLGKATQKGVHINLNRLNKYLCGKEGVEKLAQQEKAKNLTMANARAGGR